VKFKFKFDESCRKQKKNDRIHDNTRTELKWHLYESGVTENLLIYHKREGKVEYFCVGIFLC